jgi:hypothetical protein
LAAAGNATASTTRAPSRAPNMTRGGRVGTIIDAQQLATAFDLVAVRAGPHTGAVAADILSKDGRVW